VTNSEVAAFARTNQKAMLLLHAASSDYAGARCLLLNGLFAGLTLGAQAIEKLLKASISLADPTWHIVNTHDLPRLLLLAEQRINSLSALQLISTATKFYAYYQMRYPDNPNRPSSMNTGEIVDLDQMFMGLSENLFCPRNVKMCSGIYGEITFSLNPLNTESPSGKWIKLNNISLTALWQTIKQDYFDTMLEMYPSSPELHS
jgi:HEPN domain-containing protein